MKMLRIVKCSNPIMWYNNKIGDVVPLIREGNHEHLSREPAGYTNIVLTQDCEIIEVPEHESK